MTTQQLESLLLDQAFGELSEEASALLESYLAHFPERREEVEQVRRAVGLTEAAVVSRPLAFALDGDAPVFAFPPRAKGFSTGWRIAASVALLGLALGAGFFAGKEGGDSNVPRETIVESSRPGAPSPWARYRFEPDGRLALIASPDPNS